MMAIPIWLSMVWLRLLVNRCGAIAIAKAKPPQIITRDLLNMPGFVARLEACNFVEAAAEFVTLLVIGFAMTSAFSRAQQALGPEDQYQHQKQIRQDRGNLTDFELP